MSNSRSSALLNEYYTDISIELGLLRNAWQELYLSSPNDPKLVEMNEKYVQPVIKNGVTFLRLINELTLSLNALSERSGGDF